MKVEFFNSFILGLMFIMFGIMDTIKMSQPIEIILLLLVIIGLVCSSLKGKGENDDEMSKINKMKANSRIMSIVQVVACIVMIYAIKNHTLIMDLRKIIPFFIGFTKLAYFGLFVFYEKVGE